MYRLFLSFRFLRHHWLMTLIGSFFVGASLVILVVVMSVMDGFQAKLKETIAGSAADLTLTPKWDADPLALSRALEDLLPEVVVAAAPYYETITLTRRAGRVDNTREKMHYAGVYGIDAQRESRINSFRQYLSLRDPRSDVRTATVKDLDDPFKVNDALEAASGAVGVIVGVGLMDSLEVKINQKIRIAIAEPPKDEGGNGPQEISLKYLQVLVVGVYQSGNSEVDKSCIFMDHRAFRGMFSGEVARASVRCRLVHPDDDDLWKTALPPKMNDLVAASSQREADVPDWQRKIAPETWKQKNRTLVQAIESEKSMILVIVFLIVIAGTSSIFAAQWLLVSDKVREIGILRALGADFGGVVSIFVLNGFLMGLLGSAGGTFGGLLVVRYIDAVHEFITTLMGHRVFNKDVYLFDSIPTLVDHAQVARYALAALACTLVAAAVPALRAGLLNPAEALHRD